MVSNRVLKFILSLVIALISTLYQLESDDELLLTEKRVMLSKNKTFCFDSLTDLEQFPSVISSKKLKLFSSLRQANLK